MDHDRAVERPAAAYYAIVHDVGELAVSADDAIARAYARGENDEFVTPTVIDGVDRRVRDGDAIIHCNYRADRARQLIHALTEVDFEGFDRARHGSVPRDRPVVTMTFYDAGLPVEVPFPAELAPAHG